MVSTSATALTPTLTRRPNFSSPRTPIDFISPSASLKKKGPVALTSHTGTLTENDDVAEKRQRLLSRVTALALQSPGSTTPKSSSRVSAGDGRSVNGSTGLTNVQLKDLYSNCIKLSTENKINAKNAFGLHLIDYMQELLTNLDKDQGVTNFQIASCTLDAGAKIYAGRVDSIHAQAYKMLGGLGRAENANEGDEGSSDAPEGEGEKTAKKKKAHKTARTIETNVNSLNVDHFDLEFEVDPLFHKTSASFDEGGTRGLLLNHLSCRDDSCETLLDSNTITTPTMADFDWGSSQTLDLSELKDLERRISSQAVLICPHFAEFCFTNWDKNAETAQDSEIPVSKTNEHAFDMDAPAAFEYPMNEMPEVGHGGFSDDDGNGMDEGPCSNMTMGATLGFADGQEAQIILPGRQREDATATGSVAQTMGNLVLSLSSEQSEYSYFKDNILGMWAGPEHWKNRAQFNALKGLNKNGSKTKKNGCRKEPFRIDFNGTHDFDKLFFQGKASTVLAKSTLEKHSLTSTTLPEDLHYDFNSLLKLFLKPKLLVRRQYGVRPEMTDDGDGNDWYDYGNPNDCANYCPDVQDDDAGDDDVSGGDLGGFHEDSSQEMSQALSSFNSNETVFHGDNLVAQPNKVQKIDIGYAKTAKKIDVKKLKKGMWEILVSSPSENDDTNKENVPDTLSNHVVDGDVDIITKPCSFSDLYSKIPAKISKNMAKSLSVPIAFVCLLHLANEKTLKILGQSSMEDFGITQGI